MKITVLGAGLVGNAIARDLAGTGNYRVKSVDFNQDALNELIAFGIETEKRDLTEEGEIEAAISDADIVVGSVPGWMGFDMLKRVINCGKDIVDISFFPEDALELNELAIEKGVTAIVDCGVAPGMSNLILGYHAKRSDVKSFTCYVGGLPVKREWPYEYKAVFSPADVIEEYVRPARYVQNGKLVVREALSDTELIEFDSVGTLEAWNSDGLRSILKTMSYVPDMIEKTLRYPGSVEYLKVLKASGFFSEEPIEINGTSIRPLDFTSKILFPLWKLKDGEKEFTIMKIIVEDNIKRITYDLLDYFDDKNKVTSMARTTGYTCTGAVGVIANKLFEEKGVFPPELIGHHEPVFTYILNYLEERGINYLKSEYRFE